MYKIKILFILLLYFLTVNVATAQDSASVAPSIIPIPVQYELGDGHYTLSRATRIVVTGDNAEVDTLAMYLADLLSTATWETPTIVSSPDSTEQTIELELDNESDYKNDEAYALSVTP